MIKHHVKNGLLIGAMSLMTIVFTSYIFASAYEVLAQKDLPIIESVHSVDIEPVLNQVLSIFGTPQENRVTLGNLGEIETLGFPGVEQRLFLSPALYDEKGYLSRANRGHYLIVPQSEQRPSSVVVYARRDWRTITNLSDVVIGSHVYLSTSDKWNVHFKVTDKKILKGESLDFVLQPDKNAKHLVILIRDDKADLTFLFSAEFSSATNVDQL